MVRPQNLVSYTRLVRDPDNDLITGVGWTVNGTPTVEAHPPLIFPSAQILQFPPVAAAGGTTVTPGAGSLTISSSAPSAEITHIRAVPTPSPALTLSGETPFRIVNYIRGPPVGSLAFSSTAPTVSVSSGAITVTPSVGSLAFSSAAPSAEITHIRQMTAYVVHNSKRGFPA